MTTDQVAPLRLTATRADQTVPTLTMAHIDRIARARTSEAEAARCQSMRNTEAVMSNFTHETVPTRFVENGGIRFAYRRFGKPGGPPPLFLEYFNSNMDGWDPAVTNSLAADHEVILFDNADVV